MITLPIDLMIVFCGPFWLIEGGLFDIGYQYALFMNNIMTLAQVAGAFFFLSLSKLFCAYKYIPFKKVILGVKSLKYSSNIFFFLFLLNLLAVASAEFGVLNWLINPRQGYQLYRAGQGHWYILANSTLAVSFVLALLAKPNAKSMLLTTVVYLFFGYFLGSKSVLLAMFITTLVFLWFIRWHHLGKIVIIGTPIVFSLMILNLYLALGDGIELQSLVTYFDHYKNGADYYRAYLNHEINLFYGDVFFSSLWSYVPRAFYSEKPWVYGITIINEIFYPGQAELTNTPAFGGGVEQFADFGIFGVIIFGFFSSKAILTGIISDFIFRKPGTTLKHITLPTVMLMLIQYAPGFGGFLPSGLYILLLVMILLLLRIMASFYKSRISTLPIKSII